jgi:hypothetical protein
MTVRNENLLADVMRALYVFAQWTILGVIVDVVLEGSSDWRKGASVYLMSTTWLINIYSLTRSYLALGRLNELNDYTETIFGLFFEIVALMQAFGLSWCTTRLYSLDTLTTYGQPFHNQSFLSQLGNSIFEMSLVMSGVGWAATPPTTLGEKVVAWLTATVGGLLVVNLFLVSVVLGRRGWFNM